MAFFSTDVKVAARSLLRSRSFAAVTILTIGVAIGANSAIFSVVNAVLLEPLPYPDSDELVTMTLGVSPDRATEELPFSDRGFWHFVVGNQTFEHFGGYTSTQLPLTEGEPVQLTVGIMTLSAFQALGIQPALGRFPTAEEDAPGAEPVAVLSQGLWAGRFGADPAILSRSIELNGTQVTVIGVMPHGYAFPSPDIDLWVPYRLDPANPNFGGHHIRAVGRLRDGASPETAGAEAAGLISRFGEVGYGPEWLANVFSGTANVGTLRDELVGESTRPLLIILGSVAFVLLIACSNVTNLLLVRAESRSGETAVRAALGASRWRLVRGVLTESILLTMLGGLLGVILAYVGIRLLVASAPVAIPRLEEIGMNGTVLLFTSAVAVGAGILVGIVPAHRVWSQKSFESIRDGGRNSTIGKSRHRTRSLLVVAQIALALILLVGSGLMVRSFQQLRAVDPGFEAESIMTFSLALPNSYTTPEQTARFYTNLLARLEALPGVVSAAGITVLPLSGGGPVLATVVEEFPPPPGDFPEAYAVRRVTPGYFETMGIPLVEGRPFEERDHDQRLGTTVVSEAFRERYWPRGSALGKRLSASGPPADIIAVVGDVRYETIDTPSEPVIYLPMLDSVGGGVRAMDMVVRTDTDPAMLMPGIRREVQALDPVLPITDVRTMQDIVGESMGRTTFTMTLLVIAAFVAVFLGCVGIYGVISYVVEQRKTEMGVRQALGATQADVRGMIMRQGMLLALAGVLIGLVVSGVMGRMLSTLLYGVDSFDLPTFLSGALVFTTVAAVASLIPAMRAAKIQPAAALREEAGQ